MARAPTTADAFNAIAEPQRRQILEVVKQGERPVLELAEELRIAQPNVSKHLRVLREVRLVRVREVGKQRLYGLDARGPASDPRVGRVPRDRGRRADARPARRLRRGAGGNLMAGKVFFSVAMTLDGFIAPEQRADDPEFTEWMAQWMQLQHWAFKQRFFRENLKLGSGGEEGVDNTVAEDT
jgi:DNA-binding transcriptional ArsR family regulator